MEKTLTRAQAKDFYDRFGSKQDRQAFYEDRAIEDMIAHGDFGAARAIMEFGCGTGRVAERLLADQLAPDCTYLGVDISTTMVGLARDRLRPWADRARVELSGGEAKLDADDGSFDRFITTYVLDLLGEPDIEAVIGEARRVLAPGGLFCAAGLTFGETPLSRAVTWLWQRVAALNPRLVGGCRPVRARGFLDQAEWELVHHAVVSNFGIASEVVIARRR